MSEIKPTLVVMAAGMGSRYGGLKQIDPMGPHGEVVIDYSVYDARRAGYGKVVFILRKSIEQDFRETVGRRIEEQIDVDYVFQELSQVPEGFQVPEGRTKPWGTTHAVLAARKAVHEPFTVINADDYYGRHSFEQLGAWQREFGQEPHRYCLEGFVLENTLSDNGGVSRGVCVVDEQGNLKEIEECHEIKREGQGVVMQRTLGPGTGTGKEVASMNMWGFNPGIFEQFEASFSKFIHGLANPSKGECLVPTTVHELIVGGEAVVNVLQTPGKWMGVTYPEDKPVVQAGFQALINAHVYPENLWA